MTTKQALTIILCMLYNESQLFEYKTHIMKNNFQNI
jgi:hypothetical protein